MGTDSASSSATIKTEFTVSGEMYWKGVGGGGYKVLTTDNGSSSQLKVVSYGVGSFEYTTTGVGPGFTPIAKDITDTNQFLFDGFRLQATDFNENEPNNYIAWAVTLNDALYAIGWANIDYDPFMGGGSDAGDTFTVTEWAYSYGAAKTGFSATSIDFGDKDTGGDNNDGGSNGAVPEPGSLAIFGLIGLGAIASRRRR